jgi:hypothetical protein
MLPSKFTSLREVACDIIKPMQVVVAQLERMISKQREN